MAAHRGAPDHPALPLTDPAGGAARDAAWADGARPGHRGGGRPVAVFDIDGVLADVTHRLTFLQRQPKQWEQFFRAAATDPLLDDGAALLHALSSDHDVMYLTGRPERTRGLTERWLRDHDLPDTPLHMRPDHDRRPARLHKRETLRRIGRTRQVGVVVDDDPAVVALLTADGWPVRLATWLPHSSTLRAAQERDGAT